MPIILPGMTDSQNLLASIERFCAAAGMAPTTFGLKAVNDGKLVPRLRHGGSVRLETATAVRGFIRQGRRRRIATRVPR